MIHYGDITQIDGSKIPVVDGICFGSPCQDLSVAGCRKGLKHEENGDNETTRSGLFFEAIRVIKQMREGDKNNGRADFAIRPRFIVFENVPGLFSSNRGKDFQAVLTEIVRITQPDAPDVPLPEKGWSKSGCLMGYGEDGCPFSIAWRVHDAQFWGVPQRRKRIALVADFGGVSASEILFVRKGCSGNPEPSGEKRKGTAGDSETGSGEPDKGSA